jgi:predicted GIY-YIG superfamily endonuclease
MTIGYIYKISSPSIDSVYIGSTTKTIKERLQQHKKDSSVILNAPAH